MSGVATLRGRRLVEYSTLSDSTYCFRASDMTNLELVLVFAGTGSLDAHTIAFYTRCSDYDGSGALDASDLTNMARYYAGLLPIAPHIRP
eukprot:4515437-Prymnesium_polylepis.2